MLSISTNADAFQTSVNPENITPSHSDKKKHKKKKRVRDEGSQDNAEADPEARREKKKKRKLRDQEPMVGEAAGSESVPDVAPDVILKPKKKRKEKGKGRDTLLTEQTDAEIEANSQASAAALLSAIVAASITNPETPQVDSPPEQLQAPQGQAFAQYPAMQYGYPGPPPPSFDPQLQSIFTPPGGGSAFSELAFGSNEELLRALQELDMSKIAHVLKSLSEAATTNGPSHAFAPQFGFIPTQLEQLPPSSLGQLPVGSHAILGIPPKQTVAFSSHKRTIDMSLPGNELHTNSDHAYLLANKWLTASKLADLVRDEGLSPIPLWLKNSNSWCYRSRLQKREVLCDRRTATTQCSGTIQDCSFLL